MKEHVPKPMTATVGRRLWLLSVAITAGDSLYEDHKCLMRNKARSKYDEPGERQRVPGVNCHIDPDYLVSPKGNS